jgi:uncharacterized protein
LIASAGQVGEKTAGIADCFCVHGRPVSYYACFHSNHRLKPAAPSFSHFAPLPTMTSTDLPLSDAELELLDQFLMDRIDEDADTTDKDIGIFDIASLDGFFTAIVSAPVMVLPSQWLSALWGDYEKAWKSRQEFEEIFGLLVRHMNSIAAMLMHQPEDFEPLFYEREVEGKTYLVVDEWCEGYSRAC